MRKKPVTTLKSLQPGERIVAAARGEFFTHGFRGVTMDDLARTLGMSKKTLYASFAGKTELLRAVLQLKFREVEADMEQATGACVGDFGAGLRALLAQMQRHTSELKPPFIRDMAREAPELFKLVQERRALLIQKHFGRLLTEGRKAGLVRADVPVQIIIDILLAATEAVVNPPNITALNMTPHEAYTAVLKIVLEGAMTSRRKGAVK